MCSVRLAHVCKAIYHALRDHKMRKHALCMNGMFSCENFYHKYYYENIINCWGMQCSMLGITLEDWVHNTEICKWTRVHLWRLSDMGLKWSWVGYLPGLAKTRPEYRWIWPNGGLMGCPQRDALTTSKRPRATPGPDWRRTEMNGISIERPIPSGGGL